MSNIVAFPILPMSPEERAELTEILNRVLETSERQREARRLLGPLKLWAIFAVKILEEAELPAKLAAASGDEWMLHELRKAAAASREIAELFDGAVARLEAMEEDDDDGGRAA